MPPAAPAPMADTIVITSFTPAKTVVTVESVCTKGISLSMKLPKISRPYCTPMASNAGPRTAVGMPRFSSLTVKFLALSARTVADT